MLFVMVVLGLLSMLGGRYLKIGRARSLDAMRRRVSGECRCRLECMAHSVQGRLVEGPALETPEGRIELVASDAPANWVVDTTKFEAAVGFKHVLNVVSHRDADRAIRSKAVRPVEVQDPEVASGHRVFSSDETFARAVVTAGLIQAMVALDAAVRARTMLRTGGGRATVIANRGLAEPAELKAFHDGCVGLVALLGLVRGGEVE